jgi:hypothetical protein
MPKHNIPTQFSGLAGILLDLVARIESLERRPRFGTERITITTDATLDPVTRYVWVNAGTNINVTLPDQWDGATVTFKNVSANTVTVTPQSGTVDGGATASFFGVNVIRTYQSDGVNWISL